MVVISAKVPIVSNHIDLVDNIFFTHSQIGLGTFFFFLNAPDELKHQSAIKKSSINKAVRSKYFTARCRPYTLLQFIKDIAVVFFHYFNPTSCVAEKWTAVCNSLLPQSPTDQFKTNLLLWFLALTILWLEKHKKIPHVQKSNSFWSVNGFNAVHQWVQCAPLGLCCARYYNHFIC